MENIFNILEKSSLFYNISKEDIKPMLDCLCPVRKEFSKNEFILHSGEAVKSMGMVLKGSVHIIKEDYWGNRNILSCADVGELFAEVYACTQNGVMGPSVVAAEDCEVIFLDARKALAPSGCPCGAHSGLMRNLLSVIAEKTLMMNDKLAHISQRTTRDKLLSYLSAQAIFHKSASFDIPFSRQQLADYLSVDRSAMSNELCKMRDEELLTFNKNHFVLTT